MKMLKISNGRDLFKLLNTKSKLCGKRFFLSEAFKCEEAWNNRLKAPIFQKVQFGSLFAALEKQFLLNQRINVLDIDIFINGAKDDYYTGEIESLLFKLRSEPETSILSESATHAAIRRLLIDKKKGILNVLSQRLEFGLYPDTYLSILMMDTFMKDNDYLSAVKVAVLDMLQEDCNHPILRSLSLYACLKYLNSPVIWESSEEGSGEDNDEDEDEVENIRVKYLRNEFFDDHFDIKDTNHLVGKTMWAFGKTVQGPLGVSNQLVGLILYEKYDEAKNLINKIIETNKPVFKEAIEKAQEYLETKPKKTVEKNDETEEAAVKTEETAVKTEEAAEKTSQTPEIGEPPDEKTMLIELLDKLKDGNVLDGSLENELKSFVEKEVKDHEEEYIVAQCKKYQLWEKKRLENIEAEAQESQKIDLKDQVAKLKEELEEEEKKIFYFDLEDDFQTQIQEIEKQKKNVTFYKEKKKKVNIHDSYVPPKL